MDSSSLPINIRKQKPHILTLSLLHIKIKGITQLENSLQLCFVSNFQQSRRDFLI